MLVRWNYKLLPNNQQDALMDEWLVTLRKHRNYSLRERSSGWDTNNKDADDPITYAYGAYCDIQTKIEVGACCPLTCPILKHGVLADVPLTKTTKEKVEKKTGEIKPSLLEWDSVSGIQSKRTTQLRQENAYYARIDSGVLQRNLAKLDAAYSGFWQHERGFPAYRTRANFNSFEYKPGRVIFKTTPAQDKYSRVYLPGIGWMRYFDSRSFQELTSLRTITIKREADGWYMSVLLNLPKELPEVTPLEDIKSINGLDVGINKLIASSDGSFVENPKFATSKRVQRRLRIRQRRVSRKQKGSKNRAKTGKVVAKLHKQIADQRESYQWQAANREVKKADAVAHEDLNITGMKKRCKPKIVLGRFMPNGQSAKRGLNRAISDASWGQLFQMIAWVAAKAGKPVIKYNPKHTSQECSQCHHVSIDNRDGEKFLCSQCGHIDHADTQAARTGLKRVGLKFVSTRHKNLPADCGKVMPVRHGAASNGKRQQDRNPKSKAMPKTGIIEQLSIFDLIPLETG